MRLAVISRPNLFVDRLLSSRQLALVAFRFAIQSHQNLSLIAPATWLRIVACCCERGIGDRPGGGFVYYLSWQLNYQ